jgi:hypothetical protein
MNLASPPLGPHYTAKNCARWKTRVTLDGVPQLDCLEAHTVEGWIICICRDEDGTILRYGDEIMVETVSGTVAVVIEGAYT